MAIVIPWVAFARASELTNAAKAGDLKRVTELIDAGEDMDLPDSDGIPPLMWAIMRGHEDVAVYLFDRGAALKTRRNYGEVQIILDIVKDSQLATDILMKRGPYIQAGQNYGSILFINALRYGRKDVAHVLLERDIGLRLPDDDGVTPLAYAVVFGHKKLGARLYEEGAYFYEPAMSQDDIMRLARDRGDDEVVDFILRVAMHKAPGEGLTLAEAIREGRLAAVEELIRRGQDVNAADSSGDTPLYIAAGKGNAEIVKLLIDAGADPNIGCRSA